ADLGENRAGISAYHPYRAYDDYENDGQHNRVFSDILAFCLPAKSVKRRADDASLDPDLVKCCKRRKWLKGGVRAGRHTAQDLTDSLFIAEHLVGTGVSNQENEAIRAHWRLTLDSSRLLDQRLHQAAGRW